MASSLDRENVVYVAMLAEQAERFDEMVEKMKDVAKMGAELTASERNLLSIGHKNVTGCRRASWRVLSAVEQMEKSEGNEANVKRINEYREKVAKEICDICADILSIIDDYLLPSTSSPDATVFFHKMKGDHYRYLAEIKTGTDRKEAADKSLNSYEAATLTAEAELMPADPIRLGVALNLSVLHNLIFNSPERALHIAKQAFDEAISGLDSLGEEALRNSTLTLHLLQDNIKLWSSELSEDAEVNVGNTTSLIFD